MQKTDFDFCRKDKNCNAKRAEFDKLQILWYASEKPERTETHFLQKSFVLLRQNLSKILGLKHLQNYRKYAVKNSIEKHKLAKSIGFALC
jgi:hypothetical protein